MAISSRETEMQTTSPAGYASTSRFPLYLKISYVYPMTHSGKDLLFCVERNPFIFSNAFSRNVIHKTCRNYLQQLYKWTFLITCSFWNVYIPNLSQLLATYTPSVDQRTMLLSWERAHANHCLLQLEDTASWFTVKWVVPATLAQNHEMGLSDVHMQLY